jgi:hypothetical protein
MLLLAMTSQAVKCGASLGLGLWLLLSTDGVGFVPWGKPFTRTRWGRVAAYWLPNAAGLLEDFLGGATRGFMNLQDEQPSVPKFRI